MIAVTDAEVITGGVVLLFAALAIIAVLRIVLRREDRWTRIRFGVFIERNGEPGARIRDEPEARIRDQ